MNDPKVDYRVHESALARMERMNKRLFLLCIVVFIAFMASNIGWLIYESRFEDNSVTQEVDTGDGNANVVGIGDYYGEDKTDR